MFKRLAEFRLLKPRRIAPGLREAMPANDNLPGFRRPGGPRRIRSQVLVCHWSPVDGGTRLGCRWQAEAPAQTALENPDSERRNKQTFQSPAIRLDRRRNLQNLPRWERDQGGHPKCATVGSHWSFLAGRQNLALCDDPSS
jgi:hypothetical protein